MHNTTLEHRPSYGLGQYVTGCVLFAAGARKSFVMAVAVVVVLVVVVVVVVVVVAVVAEAVLAIATYMFREAALRQTRWRGVASKTPHPTCK